MLASGLVFEMICPVFVFVWDSERIDNWLNLIY